jgi:hypothetical protein
VSPGLFLSTIVIVVQLFVLIDFQIKSRQKLTEENLCNSQVSKYTGPPGSHNDIIAHPPRNKGNNNAKKINNRIMYESS